MREETSFALLGFRSFAIEKQQQVEPRRFVPSHKFRQVRQ